MLKKIFNSELRSARKARRAHNWDKAIESLGRCLDILEAQEAAEHTLHPTGGTPHAAWCASRSGDICDCGGWQPRQRVS